VGIDEQEPHWLRTLKRISAVAAALGAIAGFLFLLFPRLKPPEPPQKRSVTLSELKVESWSHRQSNNIVLRFSAHIDGHQGEPLPIMWTLYNADTGDVARYPQELGPQEAFRRRGSPTSGFTPTVQSESLNGEIHIPSDSSFEGRTWKIRLEITDAHGNPLGDAETERFFVSP
jgi:hypothetical protein